MADKCSTEAMLEKVVGPCASGEEEAVVIAYNTLESYLLMMKSRDTHHILATEKSWLSGIMHLIT